MGLEAHGWMNYSYDLVIVTDQTMLEPEQVAAVSQEITIIQHVVICNRFDTVTVILIKIALNMFKLAASLYPPFHRKLAFLSFFSALHTNVSITEQGKSLFDRNVLLLQ